MSATRRLEDPPGATLAVSLPQQRQGPKGGHNIICLCCVFVVHSLFVLGPLARNSVQEPKNDIDLPRLDEWSSKAHSRSGGMSTITTDTSNRSSYGGLLSIKNIPNLTSTLDLPSISTLPTTNNETTLTWTPIYENKTATLCLIVKDPQRRYIDEWADYHILAIGFTKVRIYDNTAEFSLRTWATDTAKPYPVEVIHVDFGKTHPWPNASTSKANGVEVQDFVYRDCIQSEKEKGTDWVAATDLDEFLVFKHGTNVTNIFDFMDEYCPLPCGQISLNWLPFGTCNRSRYVPVPVTRRFFCSEAAGSPWVKAIVDPKAVNFENLSEYWIHTFPLYGARRWLDTNGKIIKARNKRWNMQQNADIPLDVAVLHHYGTKSKEELRFRNCVRGDVNNHTRRALQCKNQAAPKEVPTESIVEDDSAWQILRKAVPSYQKYDHVTDLG